MNPKECYTFEAKQLGESINRQIDRIISDLQRTKDRIKNEDDPSWTYPKNDIMDLTQRIGELAVLQRVVKEFKEDIPEPEFPAQWK